MTSSRISKIFISHAHGDHAFGLAGVLCMLGQAIVESKQSLKDYDVNPIDIYGPEGIRDYVRAILQLTYSRIAPPHRIHELKDLQLFDRRKRSYPRIETRADSAYGERAGGKDIYPNSFGEYKLTETADAVVYAAPMEHTVPCVGFVFQEKMKLGRINPEKSVAAIQRNFVSTNCYC
jgi:ribonuclease Z